MLQESLILDNRLFHLLIKKVDCLTAEAHRRLISKPVQMWPGK